MADTASDVCEQNGDSVESISIPVDAAIEVASVKQNIDSSEAVEIPVEVSNEPAEKVEDIAKDETGSVRELEVQTDSVETKVEEVIQEDSVSVEENLEAITVVPSEDTNGPTVEVTEEDSAPCDVVIDDSAVVNDSNNSESAFDETKKEDLQNNSDLLVLDMEPLITSEISIIDTTTDETLENIQSQLLKLTEDSEAYSDVVTTTEPPSEELSQKDTVGAVESLVENKNIVNELSAIHGEQAPTGQNGIGEEYFSESLEQNLSKICQKDPVKLKNKDDGIINFLSTVENESFTVPAAEGPVLNNLQLLAILEGGTESLPSPKLTSPSICTQDLSVIRKHKILYKRKLAQYDSDTEKSLALKQLRELPLKRKKKKQNIKTTAKKIIDVKIPKGIKKISMENLKLIAASASCPIISPSKKSPEVLQVVKKDKIVNTYCKKNLSKELSSLIEDWTDDEGKNETEMETNKGTLLRDEIQAKIEATPVKNDDSKNTPKPTVATVDKDTFVEPTPRRVSRIIKKKVIYDPDNPETYKFASAIIKKDTSEKKSVTAQDENVKSDVNAEPQKAAGKKQVKATQEVETVPSPVEEKPPKRTSVSPSPKKKNLNISLGKKKKLTEVDKLLMDEGAVNMIYQLERSNNNMEVPELGLKPNKKSLILISKEKRALMSKAKIIKKAVISQSKVTDSKVIKAFRVRKENKPSVNNNLDGSGKASSLRSFMQSPSLSEISAVETCPDESRIIRRHSSSSFSSGCLSPRPQSPTGDGAVPTNDKNDSLDGSSQFINDSGIQNSTPVVRKKRSVNEGGDSVVLKRKHRSTENLRASVRQKKKADVEPEAVVAEAPTSGLGKLTSFTQLSLDVADNIAHIVVQPNGNSEELYDLQVVTELTEAVRVSSSLGAVVVSSAEGGLCGGLDLRGLLQPTLALQRHNSEMFLDAFRELMVSMCECRAALVCSVNGACVGPGVALLTLCDLVLASDRATFCVAPRQRRRLPPEGAGLLTRPYALPPQIGRELVLCGRKLTASEALQRGLVARTLWPDRFSEEVRSIALDLAHHPAQSFSIMKNVLRRGEVTAVTAALRHESRLLMDFWCSLVGQEAIRETHAHL